MIRQGLLPLAILGGKLPVTVGVEAAGTVEKLGDKVKTLAVGDRVAYTVIGSSELGVHFFFHLKNKNYCKHDHSKLQLMFCKSWLWHQLMVEELVETMKERKAGV